MRLPRALADKVEADADRDDLTLSDTLGNIIAAHYGHAPVALPHDGDHEQMKLTA